VTALSPGDKPIEKLLAAATKKQAAEKAKQKKTYAKMFG